MSRKKPVRKAAPAPAATDLIAARVAFTVALAVTAFLAWSAFKSGGLPGCGPDSGCDRVLNSRWSRVFGIPVSVLAFGVYAILLGETFRKATRWPVVSTLSVLVVASVLWFVLLQAAVVKAFCTYCMTAHLAGLIGAGLLLRRAGGPRLKPALLGTAAAAVFAAAQSLGPAPGPKQVAIAGGSVAAPPGPEIFSILGGQFRLDLSQVPVSGDPKGTHRVVKLFDYTCVHCRDLHHLLADYRRTNALTLISLPMPLDPNCNPLVTKPHPDHEDACEYARTGLAVFYAKPDKFEAFSDWLFRPGRPFAISETRAYAAGLVGSNEFQAALRDPRVDQQLRTNIAIYMASSQRARNGRMPQLIFQHSASVGSIEDPQQLARILAANLNLTNTGNVAPR